MENEPTNPNTEENDIVGYRANGPGGNPPGRPGGSSANAAAHPASASGGALAAAETSMGEGAIDTQGGPCESQEANPGSLNLEPSGAYGGNFGNGPQSSFNDKPHRENQDSDPNRGEFGVQSLGGTTQGGFGNQNRAANYGSRNLAAARYYGGFGAPGPQNNAYPAYEDRHERPDTRPEYGFEAGPEPAADASATSADANQNDNGAVPGPDSGYAQDYGHTSLRGARASGSCATPPIGPRNQTEDYLPAQGPDEPALPDGRVDNNTNLAGTPGPRSAAAGQPAPTGRTGYVQAPGGDSAQGIGSRGGSYNDAYDDSRPGSTTGSPAKGDQRCEDTARNYGAAAREENRATAEENDADHGAPQRNAGRE